MTNPEKNPRTGSMIMSMAAVWETSPKDTQVVNFPALWKDGFAMVKECKQEVSQTLSVSPAGITQGAAGSKAGARPNQAMSRRSSRSTFSTPRTVSPCWRRAFLRRCSTCLLSWTTSIEMRNHHSRLRRDGLACRHGADPSGPNGSSLSIPLVWRGAGALGAAGYSSRLPL
jgi:hypothetical protein